MCLQVKAKAMMGAIHKESPPEHWDNSMTTRTLLLKGIVHSQQNFRCWGVFPVIPDKTDMRGFINCGTVCWAGMKGV